ncbi:MAG: preprotein translocase subunit YajC [Pseudobdellovibrionaceae bacterium]
MQAAQPTMLEMFMPFIIVFGIMYFLMIRPQGKRQKLQDQFLKNLKRGDQVLTSSGILATVDGLTEQFVILEISEGVKVRMLKKQVAGPASAATQDVKKG